MKKAVFIASLGIAALLAGPVSALTLFNEDAATYEVTVVTGQGDADVETVVVESGSQLTELCMDGCTMQLPNGISQSFAGSEEVSILDGEFVIAE